LDQGYYWITVSVGLTLHTRVVEGQAGVPREWYNENLALEQAEAIVKYLTENHGFVERSPD